MRRVRERRAAIKLLCIAVAAGASVGIASVAFSQDGPSQPLQSLKNVNAKASMTLARDPQQGDHWSRCADAKAAGTFPIYRGEPGYRDGLDGDNDGIACEPYWRR